jgi:SAM-dependent methyltransferase
VASIYDHPLYYDVLFGWDRSAEAGFYHEAFLHHGVPREGRVLEVACGTGQIALRLARRGWRMTGLDRSAEMLAFLAEQAEQEGVSLTLLCADMTSLVLPERQHAACNPLSSFRLLLDEDAALSHLRCMAAALEPGGVYILDTAFGTSGEAEDDLEEWVMERDDIEIHARPERIEVQDGGRGRQLTLDWHEQMHPYTPASFQKLVASAGRLSIEACYPESGQSEEGVSLFELQHAAELPAQGRAMVVLRREA